MEILAEFVEPVKNQILQLVNFNIDELEIPSFQRDLSSSLSKHLELAIEKLGFLVPIIIVQKDGINYVVDGMHRLEAMKNLGMTNIIGILIKNESLYHNILDFNTERPPNVKEKAKQTYRLFTNLIDIYPHKLEIEFNHYLKEPAFITLGLLLEEIDSKFPVGFYDDFISKIDYFLELSLLKAFDERRKRAEAIYDLHKIVINKFTELGFTDSLKKGEVLRKAIQKTYGNRVRIITDEFYEAIEKVKEICQTLTIEDFQIE